MRRSSHLCTAVLLLCLTTVPAIAQANPTHWCSYLGGSGGQSRETPLTVAEAPNGDVVVAGRTPSADFPTTAGVLQTTHAGIEDAFVARVSADGSQLLASTLLGGNHRDEIVFVQVVQDGSVWVGGSTVSTDFPTTIDAYLGSGGNRDTFIAHLSADLSSLLYSTRFGGLGDDHGTGFAVDEVNQLLYVAGQTGAYLSTWGVPTTPTALKRTVQQTDQFLAVLDQSVPGQTTLRYGTLIGGSDFEKGLDGLSVDANGVVTVTATTTSTDFPVTANAFQTSAPGGESGVIARIDPALSGAASLVYGSYFGGSANDETLRHAADASGVLHLLATSNSSNWTTTPNALFATGGTSSDVFYAQLDPSQPAATALVYGSWIAPGNHVDRASAIAVGPSGVAVFVESSSLSSSLTSTPGAFQVYNDAAPRGYALLLDVQTGPGPVLEYATFYTGCSGGIYPSSVAIAGNGDLLLAGRGGSAPVTFGVFQFQRGGADEGFVGRLEPSPWPSAFRTFGASCAGSAGTPDLHGVTTPRLCGPFHVRVTNLPTAQIGVFDFGSDISYGGAPLPIPLDFAGAPGCAVLVAPDVVVARATGTGTVDLNFTLPNVPRLVGEQLPIQFLFTDPTANTFGIVTTNGLVAEVRW